jgi:hypothetical protein
MKLQFCGKNVHSLVLTARMNGKIKFDQNLLNMPLL